MRTLEVIKDLAECCLLHRFDFTKLRTKSRKWPLVKQRAVASHYLRDKGYSYPVIGWSMNRDHSSIMHLCKYFDVEGNRK